MVGASGGFRRPGASLRSALDDVARVTCRLSDVRGEALWVYVQVISGELQVTLAVCGTDGNLRLSAWQSTSSEPALSWAASEAAGGWVLVGAHEDTSMATAVRSFDFVERQFLLNFLDFWREHGEVMVGTVPHHEAALHLLLMAYLSRRPATRRPNPRSTCFRPHEHCHELDRPAVGH